MGLDMMVEVMECGEEINNPLAFLFVALLWPFARARIAHHAAQGVLELEEAT